MTPRLNPFDTSKDAYKAVLALNTYVGNCGLEHSLLELVKLRASQVNGCAHCIDMHAKDARKAGETEQRLHLLAGAAHGGGGGHDLGSHGLGSVSGFHFAGTEFIDHGLIEAAHRSQRPGDEVELVLDDQIGGFQPLGKQPSSLVASIARSKEALA